MIDCTQLREYIIRPALQLINLYSKDVEELLVAICAQESDGGKYVKQISGPALGIYQMQTATHDHIWNSFLLNHESTGKEINSLGYSVLKGCRYIIAPPPEAMIHNLYYATMMARCFWLSLTEEFPRRNNLNGMWGIYKIHWNTLGGSATKEEFFKNYCEYTGTKQFEGAG